MNVLLLLVDSTRSSTSNASMLVAVSTAPAVAESRRSLVNVGASMLALSRPVSQKLKSAR